MIRRFAHRSLRVRLASLASLVALAAAAVLVVPGLAGALEQPSIDAPAQNAVLNGSWDKTFTFSTASNPDPTATGGYSLLRASKGGSCSISGAATVGSASPTATSIMDTSSPADDTYCYWVEASDSAGPPANVVDSSPRTIIYDTTPPTVSIGTKPSNPDNDPTPAFTFSSPDSGATFECSVDSGSYSACTSGSSLSTLSEGSHTFDVQAIDAANNVSTTPAHWAWTIDLTAPSVAINSSPPDPANAGNQSFTFSSPSDGGSATFECSVDSGSFSSCSSPKSLSLGSGSHTFAVRAVDQAGNHTAAPASFGFAVDTSHPTVAFATKPASLSNDPNPAFTFTSNESPVTYECSLDSAAYATCPASFTGLADGGHTVDARAIDAAANHSTTAAHYAWTIDTGAPVASIVTKPLALSNTPTPTFTFSTTKPTGATYQCTLDLAAPVTCVTPYSPAALADGSHSLAVVAIDQSGNHSAPVSYSWTIDATPPVATFGTTPVAQSNVRTPGFTFSANEASTFQCHIDGASFATCTSPVTLASLGDGSHTYHVKATDTATNTAPEITYTWTVDATPPPVAGNFHITSGGTPRNSAPPFTWNTVTDGQGHGPVTYTLVRGGVDVPVSVANHGSTATATDSTIIADGTDDGTYHYTVRATDTYGNSSITGEVVVVIENGAPSVPANLRAGSSPTRRAPVISWDASTGEPKTYHVFRNGLSIGSVDYPGATFSDTTLPLDGSADAVYTYTVSATDVAGNESAQSSPLQIRLDATRPLPSTALTFDRSPTAAKPVLHWPASTSDDTAGYNVYRGGTAVNGSLMTTTSFTDSGLGADGTYVYTVRAVDLAGNESADSTGASVVYDSTAPGTPAASAVAAASGGTAMIRWAAVTDAGTGVASYEVRRSAPNGGAPGSLAEGTPVCGSVPPTALGCADSGLTPGATFRYSVFAIDVVGNVSLPGPTAEIAIPSTTDTTPPKAVTGFHVVVANGQVTLSWKNPKTDLATVAVVWNSKRAPHSASDGNLVFRGKGTKTTLKLPRLSTGKVVRFAVFALDKAGNVSPAARATIIVPKPSSVSLAPNGQLTGSPNLTWNPVTGATYYNVQVFEGTQAAKRVGIAWPAITKYTLPGKELKKGKTYTWYVWPGIGVKSAAKYGKLIGKVTFKYVG